MAIYRLEKKSISRGKGHNLCAAIGYRAGLKITDHNPKNDDSKTHDYSKKSDVAHREIILTDKLKNAGVELTFEQIANLVEIGETTKRGKMKKSAKLASEYVLAGSHELSLDENIQAFREFAEQQSREQGVIAMVFVHDPKLGNDARANADAGDSTKHHDPRNIHAHVVVLSRQADLTAKGQLALGDKSASELSDTDRAKKGLPPSRVWLKGVREQWANIQNKSLERHNLAPVTHLSYKELGLDLKAGVHLGKYANSLLKQEIATVEKNKKLAHQGRMSEMKPVETIYLYKQNKDIERDNNVIIKQTADSYAISAKQAIERASRTLERTAKRRPRPNPFYQRPRARTDDSRNSELKELDAQTARFNQATERAHRDAREREPTISHATRQAHQLARNDGLYLANRHHDPRFSTAQRQWLDGFADRYGLNTGDYRRDISQAVQFFSEPDTATVHAEVISMLRRPEEHPITADMSRPATTTQAEPTPTPHSKPSPRPKPR